MDNEAPNPLQRPAPQAGPTPLSPIVDAERSVLDAETLGVADAWLAVRSSRQRGILAGYHASVVSLQVAQQQGLLPRAQHQGERVWKTVPEQDGLEVIHRDEEVFVSEDHVYFFHHPEDAARYFDNHLLGTQAEYVAVYRAELPLSRLDLDPEMLDRCVAGGEALPISLDFSVFGAKLLDENEPMVKIIRASQSILEEMHSEFQSRYPQLHEPWKKRREALDRGYDPDPISYDPKRIAAVWTLYSQLSRAKQEILVTASAYSEPVHSLALMHRGPVKDMKYELLLSDYAMDPSGRESSPQGVREYIEKRLAQQAFEHRQHEELYMSLTDEYEKRAFQECCWIEDDKALQDEMQRRAADYRRTAEMVERWRKRRADLKRVEREERFELSNLDSAPPTDSPAPSSSISPCTDV